MSECIAVIDVAPVGVQGPQGEKGDKGDQGDQGIQGVPGPPTTHATLHQPGGSDPITALDGAVLTTGTVVDARLSSNVPLKNTANVFTATQQVPTLVAAYIEAPPITRAGAGEPTAAIGQVGNLYVNTLTGGMSGPKTTDAIDPWPPIPLSYAERVRRDGASHYWRLGETAGTTAADAIGGAPGTISGGVTLGQPGALMDGTTAMTFDGTTGEVLVAPVPILVPLTVEAWLRCTAIDGYDMWFSTRPHSASSEAFVLYLDPGGRPNINWQWPDGLQEFVATNRVIRDAAWHHVVWVVTASTLTCYVDGVLEPHNLVAPPHPFAGASDRPLRIGDYLPEKWMGDVDEVALYPVALTPAQVAAHYAARAYPAQPGSYPSRVVRDGASHYWRLGEASGTSARDLVGGQHGTISGGVTLNQPGALGDGDAAMTFDGVTGQVLTPTLPALAPPFTVEAWVRYMTTTDQRQILYTYTTYPYFGLTTYAAANGLYLVYSETATDRIIANTSTALNDGQWHHVAVVVRVTSGFDVYVDGVVQPLTYHVPLPSLTLPLVQPFYFGTGPHGNAWPGDLDDIAIYPYALSAAQVAAHYAARTAPAPAASSPDELLRPAPLPAEPPAGTAEPKGDP